MLTDNLTRTGLWKRSLAAQDNDVFEAQRERLRTEFIKFRENTRVLVGRIADVLPELTVHDVTHLDGLWETADLIAGDNYPLNPLEAFVFGGAVLLHDSAMCYEAYTDGRNGVRKTTAWKDAYAIERDREPKSGETERLEAADFSALRTLHASQAVELVNKSWFHPATHEPFYLIDDALLRTHCGHLIGQIASSHHWNIDTLVGRLRDQVNAPSPFPSEWFVDPIKIACLLRCADAAHINQSRAPDFLYALIRRKGLSLQHWQAQNRMAGPANDEGDLSGRTIVYTSTIPFKESDADSWWIAYDAVSLVDTEIRSSNALLKFRGCRQSAPEFKVTRVKGAQSIEDMAGQLRVQGWHPCKAELHVSNVEALIRDLGGENLYGAHSDKVEVVLRELIQNARDAVVARRCLSIESSFKGHISIQINKIDECLWLYMEDDGIGMSYEVLTGPFLDFGSSFWKSTLIQTEFPGLRSSKFRSIGRFGIGFYSTFMIADEVEVISRKWDGGLDDTITLVFKNGITLRPILRKGRVNGIGSGTSTQVRIRLKPGILQNESSIKVKPAFVGVPDVYPTLSEYLAAIVSGLDVKVSFKSATFPEAQIHGGNPGNDPNSEELLKQLSFSSRQRDKSYLSEYIKNNHHRLRVVKNEDRVFGIAAISTIPDTGARMLCLKTFGGLASTVHGRHFSEFIGYLDYKPESAKRDAAKHEAPPETIRAWAMEQMDILKVTTLTDYERCVTAVNVCQFDIDPISIARVLINNDGVQQFVTFDQLVTIAEKKPIAILKSVIAEHIEPYRYHDRARGMALIQPVANGKYLSLEMDGDIPRNPNSLIGCLYRTIVDRGKNPKWSRNPSVYPGDYGMMDLVTLSLKS